MYIAFFNYSNYSLRRASVALDLVGNEDLPTV